ncbi:MAG: MgtC/SapB family protein [Coriobacteriia bacterium]|nr:MgtC/SapB family protein [Coriobacteriia bacterium]
MLDLTEWREFIIHIAVAAAAGALIGLEREWREKSAGFRTLTLVSTGSAIFVLAAMTSLPDEGVRMMAGIATGIGFLGAGAIIQSRGSVFGLTTAATVWMASALGVTAALGEYVLVAVGTALTLIILTVLSLIDFGSVRRETRTYELTFSPETRVSRVISPTYLHDAGLEATFWRLDVKDSGNVALWLTRGTEEAHGEAIERLASAEEIVGYSTELRQ